MDTILAILVIAGAGYYLFTKVKDRFGNKPGSGMCGGCAGCGPEVSDSCSTQDSGKEQEIKWH